MIPFNIGSKYSFNTLAPAILGASFTNVSILGVFDYTTARGMDAVDLKHRTIYPMLPNGTPEDPSSFAYVSLKTSEGSKVVLALPWIDASSIQEVNTVTVSVTVRDCTVEDATRIRDSLNLLGLTNFSVSTN